MWTVICSTLNHPGGGREAPDGCWRCIDCNSIIPRPLKPPLIPRPARKEPDMHFSNTPGRTMRMCRHCMRESQVVSRTELYRKEYCSLMCGHQMIFDIETSSPRQGEQMALTSTGIERDCHLCGMHYRTFSDDAYGEFCHDCRSEQSIKTVADAEELKMIVLAYEPDKLKKAREDILAARPEHRKPRSGQIMAVDKPKVDMNRVAEAIRSMISYGVLAHDIDKLDKPTGFVIAKNGLFQVSHSDIADIISIPKEVAGVTVELKEGIKLKVPKVPYNMLAQTVAFFKAVQKKSGAEALVQIWWNTQEKAYTIHCPDQSVSGASVNHRSTFDQDQARVEGTGEAIWLHVMDIHSHNTMSAFWSGTDDGDERKAPEGRMFGVIGKVTQPIPEWKWRIRTRDGFMELGVADIFDVDLEKKVNFNVSWKVIMDCLTSKDSLGFKDGLLSLKCPVDPFESATFPEEWMSKLSGHRQTGSHTGTVYGGNSSTQRAYTPVPAYIFIANKEGTALDEYLVEDGTPKPTGKSIALIKGGTHVH